MMAYIIRHATAAELPRIRDIYDEARQFMANAGNPTQWTGGYPQDSVIAGDLERNHLYVCTCDDEILGVFCFFRDIEPDYLEIFDGAWLQDGPYGVVHRIAAARGSKGVGAACLDFAFQQWPNLRIDTHRDNLPMQKLLAKCGFQYCGIIYLTKDGSQRLAYQKIP